MISLLLAVTLSAEPALTPIDTTKWEKKRLSAFGGSGRFKFDGVLRLPPKTQTTVRNMTDSDGKPAGAVARLTLADGIQVNLLERDQTSPTDEQGLAMQESMITFKATVLLHEKKPTLRVLLVESENGLDPHVINWSIAPGFTCGQKPMGNPKLSRAQADTIIAICTSLAAK
ncbi:MAG: hypothetical protein JNK82_40885 [Myxococcaceae bacterium]|nr:hypothetical protein [Myxococcaceae bacterium]